MAEVSSRYRIVRRLGQGGMAEVFEAELIGELGFVRRVALKQLLPDALRDPSAARRFVDETRIASRLHHAHIVGVLDVGLLDDRPFQVLELVDGLDAHDLVQRAGGTLPVELALMLAHAVAHALDHAHAVTGDDGAGLGIVHRDVKPPNILVGWNGDVKLADFGIAVARDRVAYTETGAVAGTRGFIAPEQRMRAALDGRSDVFALGLTLHALCTGGTPLSDITAEARLLGGEPLVLDPALPDDVRGLIARAVAPDRRDRPSAAQLAAAIAHALAARGAGDPRSAIRGFMARFREPARKPGALDRLLGVELVPVADEGGVVRYVTDGAAAPRAPEPEVSAARPAPHDEIQRAAEPATAMLRPPAPRRAGVALIAGGAALAAVVAVVIAARAPGGAPIVAAGLPRDAGAIAPRGTAPPRDPIAPRDPAVLDAAAPPDAAAAPDAFAPPARDAAPAHDPVAAHVLVAHDAGVAASDPRAQPSRPAHPASHRHAAAPALIPPTVAPALAGHGYVQVVGEELLRARVLIDGVAVGYVPNRFEVALGHHRVEVERPDGVRLPPRELDVTSFHTARNPARPTW